MPVEYLSHTIEQKELVDPVVETAYYTRLLMGKEYIDPSKKVTQPIQETDIQPQQWHQTDEMIANGSFAERQQGNMDMNQWKSQMVQYVSAYKTNESLSPEQLNHAHVLMKFDINPDTFDEAAAERLFNTYFGQDNWKKGTQTFSTKVLSAYTNQDQTLDIHSLEKDIKDIEALSNIFGKKSKELIADKLRAIVRYKENPQLFLREANGDDPNADEFPVNALAKVQYKNTREYQNLQFLQSVQPDVSKQSPQPSGAMQTQAVTEVQRQTSLNEQPPVELYSGKSLNQIFDTVKGTPDKNQKYFVINPPISATELGLSDDELRHLCVLEPNYVFEASAGDEPKLNPRLYGYVDELQNNQRFKNTIQAIQGISEDPYLTALIAASANDPNTQADLFKTIAGVIVNAHLQNPQHIKEWIMAQDQIFGSTSSLEQLEMKYDIGPRGTRRPEGERLVSTSDENRARQLNQVKSMVEGSETRIDARALDMIEFYAKSLNIPDLILLIQRKQKPLTEIPFDPATQQGTVATGQPTGGTQTTESRSGEELSTPEPMVGVRDGGEGNLDLSDQGLGESLEGAYGNESSGIFGDSGDDGGDYGGGDYGDGGDGD
jgi:hypothetical protein